MLTPKVGDNMQTITKEFLLAQRALNPKRRCFQQHTDIHQKPSGNPYFRPPFAEGIKPIFEASTDFNLLSDRESGRCYCYLNSPEDEKTVKAWVESQGSRVFLRDGLSCSIALDVNMKDTTTGEHTPIGQLEYDAKTNEEETAINALVQLFIDAIGDLPYYNKTKLIAGVPARPGKTGQDLPTELARRIAEKFDLTDLTPHFRYAGTREQLKSLPLEERWAAWEGAQLSLAPEGTELLRNNPIILIDDKYQSGVSANFVAMILQQAGASDVYGLYAVKTMRDTDNTGNG